MAYDIKDWLDNVALGRYAGQFAENEIDLQALPHLTEEDLKEIGVALGSRRKLLAAIAELSDVARSVTADGKPSERSTIAEAERLEHANTLAYCYTQYWRSGASPT